MNKKQFADIYCTKCGTQRCEGVNSEWVDGCGHWKKEMSGLNLVEKAMDNKGIIFLDELCNDERKEAMLRMPIIERTTKILIASTMVKHWINNRWVSLPYFESMNEEVEC